jgi:hypothetical protein
MLLLLLLPPPSDVFVACVASSIRTYSHTQRNHNRRPLPPSHSQVYVGGTFVAAVLDDVVMEPLTGRLLAALYRWGRGRGCVGMWVRVRVWVWVRARVWVSNQGNGDAQTADTPPACASPATLAPTTAQRSSSGAAAAWCCSANSHTSPIMHHMTHAFQHSIHHNLKQP